MNDNKANSFLEAERLSVLTRGYAVPCIIPPPVAVLYNIVGQILIANANYLGGYGNAANAVVFPLTVVALALAVMIGDGCCAFVSLSLGSGQEENAHRNVDDSVVLCIVISLILTAIHFLLQGLTITMSGGRVSEETFVQSKEYFIRILIGIPLYVSGQALNPIIHSDGNPKFVAISTLAGAVVNIILNPIFIFGFHWGMMGAALATALGQALTVGLAVRYLCHMRTTHLECRSSRLSAYLMKRFMPLGLCSFLSRTSLVVAMTAINNMIQKYGAPDIVLDQPEYGQIPVAVVEIVMEFSQIVIPIAVGMAAGCTPVVGYNMGTNRKDRTANLLKMLLVAEAAMGTITFLIVECFPRQFTAVFEAANGSVYYTDLAIKTFRIYLCMTTLACVNRVIFIYLQSLGRALVSTLLSMVRKMVSGAGSAPLLPIWSGLDSVLYSIPVSGMLIFAMSVAVTVYTLKTLKTASLSGISGSFAPAYEPVN